MSPINLIANIKGILQKEIAELLASVLQLDQVDSSIFKFEFPPDDKMGNLAFACFPLAKIARKAPAQIAQTLQEEWRLWDHFSKIEAKGPYLNFFFSPQWLAGELFSTIASGDSYGNNNLGQGKKLMVEYSSPNTNKPLHLGHGRNNLLGITIACLLECSGYDVTKANLVNDRGIHICKSMLAYQKWGNGETPESTGKKGDLLVGDYYVLYSNKIEEGVKGLEEEAQQMLRDWEAEDPEVRKLWKMMNEWVLDGFYKSYARMGVSFDRFYYESQTFAGGKEEVLNALEKGICQKEENGAVSIDLETDKLGKKILLRGDGTTVYMTQDINTTISKFKDYKGLEGCLFVVANEQENHFKVLFKTLEKFGYDWASRCEHISYGMVTLPDGHMKSRKGNTVEMDSLMEEMHGLAKHQLLVREEESSNKRTTEEIEQVAEAIGLAAIKYYILNTSYAKGITFDRDKSISFDGATGPYLQYTHARISTLLNKAESFDPQSVNVANDFAWGKEESRLLVQLAHFPQAVQLSATERNPAVLASHVYDLCRIFNKFYYESPVLKAEDEATVQARLTLAWATRYVLQKSLKIMGIEALERM